MIFIPTSWIKWNWTVKTGKNSKTTKKEEIKDLSNTENNKKAVKLDHFNEEEIKFRENIESFLAQSIGKDFFYLWKAKDYNIFTEGVMSVVAKIITEDGNEYIFKSCNDFPWAIDHKVHTEAKALNIRRNIWVKTPKIYTIGVMSFNGKEFPYSIMEFIKPTKKITKKI